MVDVLLGLQWGDEGKGKVVDYLANNYDVVARFQGGPNAGHTLIINGEKHVLHTIPSGIFHEKPINLIGNGVVIDPITLQKEIEQLAQVGVDVKHKLYISEKASLILPSHRLLDAASEQAKGRNKIGSTLRGIGPTYMDKTGRNGLRVGDILSPDFSKKYNALKEKHLKLSALYAQNVDFNLDVEQKKWFESIEVLKSLNLVDSAYFLNERLMDNKKILAEGAQGALLDVDFGTYPFVTSSNTISAAACNGLGIAPNKIKEVIGITKAYCTRVGSGPFPSELFDEIGNKIQQEGGEFGATTGRSRRCGWIDLPALKYTIMLNGVTQLVMTKIDVFNNFDTLYTCKQYEVNGVKTDKLPYDIGGVNIEPILEEHKGWNAPLDEFSVYEHLPERVKMYVNKVENGIGIKVTMLSTGPEREKLIVR